MTYHLKAGCTNLSFLYVPSSPLNSWFTQQAPVLCGKHSLCGLQTNTLHLKCSTLKQNEVQAALRYVISVPDEDRSHMLWIFLTEQFVQVMNVSFLWGWPGSVGQDGGAFWGALGPPGVVVAAGTAASLGQEGRFSAQGDSHYGSAGDWELVSSLLGPLSYRRLPACLWFPLHLSASTHSTSFFRSLISSVFFVLLSFFSSSPFSLPLSVSFFSLPFPYP